MPLYVYENDNGVKVEELRLSKDKDMCPEGYKRVDAPQPVAFTGRAQSPNNMKDGVLRGYYDQECKYGSKWKSEFSKKQIKKAWSN